MHASLFMLPTRAELDRKPIGGSSETQLFGGTSGIFARGFSYMCLQT